MYKLGNFCYTGVQQQAELELEQSRMARAQLESEQELIDGLADIEKEGF